MADSAYSPSPRPNFAVPTQIPKHEATRHLWGDPQAGIVADRIYTSTARIHTLVFGLAAGHAFGHSEEYRTVFGADELLHVLEGTLVLANPETGDVVRVPKGGSVFFRKDTWHHAFAHGGEPLRVLEFLAPPPAAGSTGAYARSRPYLETLRYVNDVATGPLPTVEPRRSTFHVIRDDDIAWRRDDDVLCGVLVATEHLAVHLVEVNPGESSREVDRAGDIVIFGLEEAVWVRAWHDDRSYVFELHAEDACLLPDGSRYEIRNYGATTASAIVGSAPGSSG